jgi:hypothetical protein
MVGGVATRAAVRCWSIATMELPDVARYRDERRTELSPAEHGST